MKDLPVLHQWKIIWIYILCFWIIQTLTFYVTPLTKIILRRFWNTTQQVHHFFNLCSFEHRSFIRYCNMWPNRKISMFRTCQRSCWDKKSFGFHNVVSDFLGNRMDKWIFHIARWKAAFCGWNSSSGYIQTYITRQHYSFFIQICGIWWENVSIQVWTWILHRIQWRFPSASNVMVKFEVCLFVSITWRNVFSVEGLAKACKNDYKNIKLTIQYNAHFLHKSIDTNRCDISNTFLMSQNGTTIFEKTSNGLNRAPSLTIIWLNHLHGKLENCQTVRIVLSANQVSFCFDHNW